MTWYVYANYKTSSKLVFPSSLALALNWTLEGTSIGLSWLPSSSGCLKCQPLCCSVASWTLSFTKDPMTVYSYCYEWYSLHQKSEDPVFLSRWKCFETTDACLLWEPGLTFWSSRRLILLNLLKVSGESLGPAFGVHRSSLTMPCYGYFSWQLAAH